MKGFIFAAISLAAIGLAQAPAWAQDHHYDYDRSEHDEGAPDRGNPHDLDQRIRWVHDLIDRGREDGTLDRGKGWSAEDRLSHIRHDEERIRDRHDGRLPEGDRERLLARVEALAVSLGGGHGEPSGD